MLAQEFLRKYIPLKAPKRMEMPTHLAFEVAGRTEGTKGAASFAFVFPMASGHINPSLAIARSLVGLGHEVHYLCREQMREAIEDTGASFHSDIEAEPELYEGRDPAMYGALGSLQEEHGLKGSFTKARLLLRELSIELMLPGLLRWLRKIRAEAVLFCPLINAEAPLAAQILGIPSAGLLTTAGPGSVKLIWSNVLKSVSSTAEEILQERRSFPALLECLDRLRGYGLRMPLEDTLNPVGLMPSALASNLTLVTTAECLADPVPPDLAKAYEGHEVLFLGPLLDKPGAKRAAGHKFDHKGDESNEEEVLRLARSAKAEGRQVILVSLGTVITGDHADYGWKAHATIDGEKRGLCGKELCQSAWQAAFDVFSDALILLALGPQSDALENLEVPNNVCCFPTLPQVDLLRLGVDVFLTHGGQNSFMEALSTGVPMVVCPGFGDQPVNAAKAERLQIGRKVNRPMGRLEDVEAEKSAYRRATAAALREVTRHGSFKENAMKYAAALEACGGVGRATKVLLSLATLVQVKMRSPAQQTFRCLGWQAHEGR
ncbi:unnamed protein product [Effrenium voratum]|uniref:Glycosyltransferase n=1 Tax=Effrenium voratum TaxID=2562239 RepID=A0AA36IV89_9DINO|nr:unnamed protein product [Effrenium voratum]